MGIMIINKTIIPINIVVTQLAVYMPIGWGRHMNVKPGECKELDIGDMEIKQFRVYVWCGSSQGTELSKSKLRWYVFVQGAIAFASLGLSEAKHALWRRFVSMRAKNSS